MRFCGIRYIAAGAAALAGWGGVVAAGAAPAVDAAFFTREVRPVLEKSCLGCHGVGAKLSGLDLRTRAAALAGGTRGPALVPGDAAKSRLYQLVTGAHAPVMPPNGKLEPRAVQAVKRWIDGGAPWPDEKIETAAAQVWWSFKPPVLPAQPAVENRAWLKTAVDAFVLAKLEEAGLAPSPPAPRRVLIRRVYMDLIGLPPTPEEVRAFEADQSPDAWEKVVDRLLASPHYGERWGRHWLDLVRYADSSGFEGDKDRPLAYRYRDYVIEAFNKDKPYDQFVREQLAGDEIRPGDREAIIATGYLACGQEDFAMVKLPMTRADELDDLVSTTGSVFLGLTVGCARCHDHKYDPVTQTDYYRLQALFAPAERREIEIPTPEERRAYEERNQEINLEVTPLLDRAEPLRERGTELAKQAGHEKPTDEQILAALPEAERTALKELEAQIKAVEAKRPQLPKALAVTDKYPEWEPVHLLIRGDANHRGPVVPPGFILALPGGSAEVGPEAASKKTTGRRRALSTWLVSPQNPLTARVWMNRVWRQHFGRGLVNTPSNFGINGETPSHPELLDWLALKFTSLGWRLKPMHRLMLLSATYQQSSSVPVDSSRRRAGEDARAPQVSARREAGEDARAPHGSVQPQTLNAQRPTPNAQRLDPQNRLYWRMPVRRLEAEAVRDSILSVAGTLNREMGGPPVHPPVDPSLRADTFQGFNWPEGEDSPKTWRRSVYVKVKRSLLFPQLEVFDCPEISASVAQRNVTTTPNQALTMLNDPLILRQSGFFAERVAKEAGPEPSRQVEHAYWLAFGRPPTDNEKGLALRFLKTREPAGDRSPLADFCHALINLSEFVYVP
jgi:hypothetical protein